jgi:hypothetical protein
MVIVDAHGHASLDWYEPIETLLFEMDRHGVDQAVLIQINGQGRTRNLQIGLRLRPTETLRCGGWRRQVLKVAPRLMSGAGFGRVCRRTHHA